jgi:hypothetical protein
MLAMTHYHACVSVLSGLLLILRMLEQGWGYMAAGRFHRATASCASPMEALRRPTLMTSLAQERDNGEHVLVVY